jgi:ethanolamine utilization microcompartment shell protein EutS
MKTIKTKLATALAVIAAVTLILGVGVLIANATAGTQNDPLVTLGYLNDRFTPQVMTDLRGDITRAEQTLSQQIASTQAALEALIGTGSAETAVPSADRFTVVTLNRGQRLTASVGTEIMLRIGTANGFGSAPALVNYTTGATLSSGGTLVTNHMYLITIEGNGIEATADLVRVLARGEFTVN